MQHGLTGRERTRRIAFSLAISALAIAVVAPVAGAASLKTKRVSIRTGGAQAKGDSTHASISADGRYVAFRSEAPDLVGNDTNGAADIFVRDRRKKKTKRVSVKTGGVEAHGDSSRPSISADGRFVAYRSFASDLVTGDTNGKPDIFVYDRVKKKTRRVSIRTGGAQATDGSNWPSISANGRYVAFQSTAIDLVAGDSNGTTDVFVHDRKSKKTKHVSVKTGGAQAHGLSAGPSISATGRFVAFESVAPDLVVGDTNAKADIFVHDRAKKKTRRVSVRTSGAQATGGHSIWASISADGRLVAFQSDATNLVSSDSNFKSDIFVRDRAKNKTKRVSVRTGGIQATNHSIQPSITANGRYVAFRSEAPNLVLNDTNGKQDIFIRDRARKKTRRMSVRTGGAQANDHSSIPAMSADGRFVAFQSDATNLVASNMFTVSNIFVRGPLR